MHRLSVVMKNPCSSKNIMDDIRRHLVIKEALLEPVCKNIIQTIADEGGWNIYSQLAIVSQKSDVIPQEKYTDTLDWSQYNGVATLYDTKTKKVYKEVLIINLLNNDPLGLLKFRPKLPRCYIISRNLKKIKEDFVVSS